MSGVKGRSGRKKSPANVMRYLTEQIDSNWSKLVNSLIEKALEGDKETLMYCFDRRLGKPKIHQDLEVKGDILSALEVKHIFQLARQEFLEEGKALQIGGGNAIQRQGITEGSSEEGGSEA